MVKIFQKELPADCEKAIRELIKLKVYIVMDDDRIENFSDVWWKVQHRSRRSGGLYSCRKYF